MLALRAIQSKSASLLATSEDRAHASGIQHAPPYLMQVSAPILSKAGDHMLIEVRFRCGGLCGSGTVTHYRKAPKGWLRMDPLALYISYLGAVDRAVGCRH